MMYTYARRLSERPHTHSTARAPYLPVPLAVKSRAANEILAIHELDCLGRHDRPFATPGDPLLPGWRFLVDTMSYLYVTVARTLASGAGYL